MISGNSKAKKITDEKRRQSENGTRKSAETSRSISEEKLAANKKSPRPVATRKSLGTKNTEDTDESLVRVKSGVDRPFLLIVLTLVALGTIMVFSASYAYAKQNYNDSYFFATRQIRWVIVGSAVMFLVSHFGDYLLIRTFQKPFFYISMFFMAIVPFLGFDAGGATRWFQIGPINFQPSEFAKIAIILYFADYIAKNKGAGKTVIGQALPYLAVGGYMGITLLLEPHISCCIIVLLLIFVLMFFGGVSRKLIFVLSVTAVIAVAAMIAVSSHAQARILAWLHPEQYEADAWQSIQSLYAIGSGGLWGVGLGQSTQKHLYLPEPQNDYIFPILCEELGFIFAAGVLLLFTALIWRGVYIAKHSPSIYSCLVVVGIIAQVGIQTFLNIAVVTNTLPTTGIPLPFFSYGGTSLIILMAEMGMILNISRYSYIRKDK